MHNLFLFIFTYFLVGTTTENATLVLKFSNITEVKGQIMVSLNDADGNQIEGYFIPVNQKGTITYTIEAIKAGTYTLAAFHDINSDKELNTNLVGIPKEPYGFSNNARGTFGPPDLADQKFTVSGTTTQSIILK